MTTELYKVFYHVAESGSISKASKFLYVSQPAVSKAIKNLEEALGVTLFIRTAKGVELTTEGQMLYQHVAQAFIQLNEGEKIIKQLRDKSFGSVRIGMSNTLCKYYFIPHLRAFHEAYPNLKIEIVNRTSPQTLMLLEDGRLDCAIISDVISLGESVNPKVFEYHSLMTIQDIFVSKQKPPKNIITLKELEAHPMLLLEKQNATRDHLDHFLIDNQVNLNVDIEISSMEFLVEFAKIGLGIASVIGDFVEDEIDKGQLYQWVTEPKIPSRTIGMLNKKNHSLSIASRTFIEFMEGRKEMEREL